MNQDTIFGLPAMNFQMLLGIALFAVTVFLVKIIRGIQTGRLAGSAAMVLYLRTILWCSLIGGFMCFFGSLCGFRYV